MRFLPSMAITTVFRKAAMSFEMEFCIEAVRETGSRTWLFIRMAPRSLFLKMM